MNREKKDRDEQTGRFIKGNVAGLKHGAFSLARVRNIPSVRGVRALAKHLDRVKIELEKATPDLNVKKEILISQVVKTEEKICLMDMWLRKVGMIKADKARKGLLELQPCLAKSYLGFMNTQRLALMALGFEKGMSERILTPMEHAAMVDREIAEKKSQKRARNKLKRL